MKLVSIVSDRLSEKFNEDLIHYRDTDHIRDYLEEACKSLCIIPNIEFIGLEIETDESKMTQWETSNIDDSRVNQVKIHFSVHLDNEREDVIRTFYVPKLIDNKFIINGTYYYPIYQIVDNSVFVTSKLFSLKTSLMPIRFSYKKEKLVDINGKVIEENELKLNMFKQQISYLYYYFAKFGFDGTLDFFGIDKDKDLFIAEGDETDSEVESYAKKYLIFKLNKHLLFAKKSEFLKSPFRTSLLISFVKILCDKKNFDEEFFTLQYWKKTLGKIFTISNQESKCQKILFSLERITDNEAARKRLDNLSDVEKSDIYHIIMWMLENFEKIRKFHDNKSLEFKRVQCWEYLLQPLLEFFSNATYRINNTRNLTIKTLTGIFNIGPNFLLKRLLNNELIRYSDAVNDLSLFNTTLRVTFKGKGSISGSSGEVSDKYRESHPTYVGNLSVVAASAGDPGLSTVITPFSHIVDGKFTRFHEED